MKANEAPEKLYLSDFTDTTESVFYVKQDNTKKTDIEYIRKDAFVEKACEYLREHIDRQLTIYHEQTWKKRDEFIEDLKKYMGK